MLSVCNVGEAAIIISILLFFVLFSDSFVFRLPVVKIMKIISTCVSSMIAFFFALPMYVSQKWYGSFLYFFPYDEHSLVGLHHMMLRTYPEKMANLATFMLFKN